MQGDGGLGQSTDSESRPSQEAVRSGRSLGPLAALVVGGAAVILGLVAVGGIGGRLLGDDTNAGPTSTLFEFVTTDSLPPETAPVATTIASTTVAEGQFVGEATDLWLFIGGDGPLRRIDLDTGELVDFGLAAAPVMARGGDLVIHLDGPGVVGWVSASAPGEQSLRWHPGPVAPGPEPDLIWLLDIDRGADFETGEWQLVDMVTNRFLERSPTSEAPPTPDLPTVSGVTPADELPSGRSRALLSSPAVVEVARSRLADTDTRPVVAARFLADDRWLEVIRLDGGVDLIDLDLDPEPDRGPDAGRSLSWGSEATAAAPGTGTVSPDGRWLAERGGDQIALFDTTEPGFPQQRNPVRILTGLIDGDERVELLFVTRSG